MSHALVKGLSQEAENVRLKISDIGKSMDELQKRSKNTNKHGYAEAVKSTKHASAPSLILHSESSSQFQSEFES